MDVSIQVNNGEWACSFKKNPPPPSFNPPLSSLSVKVEAFPLVHAQGKLWTGPSQYSPQQICKESWLRFKDVDKGRPVFQ
jgi:hypothetical protein